MQKNVAAKIFANPYIPFLHAVLTEVHCNSARTAGVLVRTLLPKLNQSSNVRILDIGAGCGVSTVEIALGAGSCTVLGLESSKPHVALFKSLVCSSKTELFRAFFSDPATSTLYLLENMEDALSQFKKKIYAIMHSPMPKAIDVKYANAIDGSFVVEKPFDAAITNVSSHMLLQQCGGSLNELLKRLAPLVVKGGVMIMAIPGHFMVPKNPDWSKIKNIGLMKNQFFDCVLLGQELVLRDQFIEVAMDFDIRTPPDSMLLKEVEAEQVSGDFTYEFTHYTYESGPSDVSLVATSLAAYQAGLRYNKSLSEVAPLVVSSLQKIRHQYISNFESFGDGGTHVAYVAFRRQ